MAVCDGCGTECDDDAAFCFYCGSSLRRGEAPRHAQKQLKLSLRLRLFLIVMTPIIIARSSVMGAIVVLFVAAIVIFSAVSTYEYAVYEGWIGEEHTASVRITVTSLTNDFPCAIKIYVNGELIAEDTLTDGNRSKSLDYDVHFRGKKKLVHVEVEYANPKGSSECPSNVYVEDGEKKSVLIHVPRPGYGSAQADPLSAEIHPARAGSSSSAPTLREAFLPCMTK